MIPTIYNFFSKDLDLNRFNQSVVALVRYLSNIKIINGQRIEVSLTTGSNIITHNLGTTPVGYIIVKKSASVTVYDTDININTITLVSSGNATVTMEVY